MAAASFRFRNVCSEDLDHLLFEANPKTTGVKTRKYGMKIFYGKNRRPDINNKQNVLQPPTKNRNTRRILGEREMLRGHEPQSSYYKAFKFLKCF